MVPAGNVYDVTHAVIEHQIQQRAVNIIAVYEFEFRSGPSMLHDPRGTLEVPQRIPPAEFFGDDTRCLACGRKK